MRLGIDLGTTNSVVARSFVDANGNLVTDVMQIGQFFKDNWEQFYSLPSMVYFTKDGQIVGREAKEQREKDKTHVVTNAKRFMGTEHKWLIDGVEYKAVDIGAMILQHCKRDIESHTTAEIESVVITVPASFGSDQAMDTKAAAIKAGFAEDKIEIKHEPTAALLSFINEQANRQNSDRNIDFSEKKRILVFDLGGGTCDTSVIDVEVKADGSINFVEKGIGRYQELGGIDFDACLTRNLLNEYFDEKNILEGEISDKDKLTMYNRLLLGAEVMKEKLSGRIRNDQMMNPNVNVETIEVNYSIPQFYNGESYRKRLNKQQYDEYTAELYKDSGERYKTFEEMDKHKNIIGVIRKTLEDYKISKASIDYVFMTGGMSQFLTVRQKVGEYIQKPIIMPENPMNAVALGAAIYKHYNISEDTDVKVASSGADEQGSGSKSKEVDDIMTLAEAVLLDVNEGLPRVIIPKGTAVPYSDKLSGVFRTTSPSGVRLDLYAGADEFDAELRMQKSLSKEFKFPVRSGTPFDIDYSINANKEIGMKIVVDDGIHLQEMELSIYGDMKIAEQQYNLVTE